MTEVVVTGIGAVTCHGPGAARLWSAMTSARVRLPDRLPDPDAHCDLPLMYLAPPDAVRAAPGPASALAALAAEEAFACAGITPGPASAPVHVVVGSCMGETGKDEQRRTGNRPPADDWECSFAVAAHLGERFGAVGGNTSVSNACAASGYALGIATDLIREGAAEVVLTGGADAYSRVAVACFNRMGALDPVRCRPFDRYRRGTVFGEGAAMLVVESAEHAARRGASVLARLGEVGWSCDAYHPTAQEPSGDQIVRAMREALGMPAGLADGPVPEVGCVIPHGTGTQLNDVVESRALGRLFGSGVQDLPLYVLKALVGHTGGAAAALAAVAAVLMVGHGVVPPNVPVDAQDPECKVYLPQGRATPLGLGGVLVNAYAFGGNNASFLVHPAGREATR